MLLRPYLLSTTEEKKDGHLVSNCKEFMRQQQAMYMKTMKMQLRDMTEEGKEINKQYNSLNAKNTKC